ncbi:hypothetical protein [uncultured Thiodictyon sp.]|uniref:hypothetical protein n=1 Tax=uncultured Thiodictyon sp. TaxID=1846217 RepID=UPI0025FB05D6|nr:hypothetical protein [uncultured Thiodictyon sp.]
MLKSIAYILVDLDNEQKEIILRKASFFVQDEVTAEDLNNRRKKWIRFSKAAITDVIGELSYHCNRSRSNRECLFLDELITHLEFYERAG